MLMDELEWLDACEKMLVTNASIGIAQFIELISTRVTLQSYSTELLALSENWGPELCPKALRFLKGIYSKETLMPPISNLYVTVESDRKPCFDSDIICGDRVCEGWVVIPRREVSSDVEIPLRVTVGEYSLMQVRRIASEMLSSQQFLVHADRAVRILHGKSLDQLGDFSPLLALQRMTKGITTILDSRNSEICEL